jgi:hypothetical protein
VCVCVCVCVCVRAILVISSFVAHNAWQIDSNRGSCTTVPPQDINTGIFGNNITCQIPTLLTGQILPITVTYEPPSTVTEPNVIQNSAEVYNTPFCDAQPSNNINTANITMVNGADLRLQICWYPLLFQILCCLSTHISSCTNQ